MKATDLVVKFFVDVREYERLQKRLSEALKKVKNMPPIPRMLPPCEYCKTTAGKIRVRFEEEPNSPSFCTLACKAAWRKEFCDAAAKEAYVRSVAAGRKIDYSYCPSCRLPRFSPTMRLRGDCKCCHTCDESIHDCKCWSERVTVHTSDNIEVSPHWSSGVRVQIDDEELILTIKAARVLLQKLAGLAGIIPTRIVCSNPGCEYFERENCPKHIIRGHMRV